MAFNKRVDKNQKEIVQVLRDKNVSIRHTHTIGQGFPDIVVGVEGLSLIGNFSIKEVKKALSKIKGLKILEGVNLLIEIKDDSQPPSKRKLTPDEERFHESWGGQVEIIRNIEEAVELITPNE